MKYTGTKSDECTITIHNVTEEFNCTWAGRLDEDLTNRELTKRNSLGIFVKKKWQYLPNENLLRKVRRE